MIGGYFFDGTVESTGLRQAPPDTAQMIREGFEIQEARGEQLCTDRGYGPPDPCYFNVNLGEELEDLEYFADRSTHKSDLQNVAIFGSVDFDVSEKISLSAEARYASEKVTTHSTIRSMVYDYLGDPLRFEESPTASRSATFDSFNPRFTAKYQLTEGTNFYAVAAKGNKPGGFNNLNVAPLGLDTFDEETVWSFEAGTKNTFMNGGLIFNLSAYHNTITDYQLTQTVFIPAINQTTPATSNLGKVRVMGLEAEMVFRPESIEGLEFNANYSLADSEFLEGTDITEGRHNDTLDDGLVNCSIGYANPAAMDCASGDNVLPGSIVGRQLPRAPRHSFSVGMNYDTPISNNANFILNANANYESKKYVQVHNLAYYGEALLVNGSVGVESNGLSLTVWGRNLLDEDSVVASSRYIDEALSFNRAFLGTLRVPRSFGATIRKSF
jgi:outer membrane receptor protein involved in Fe transport